jgi:hypothetical protein
MLWVRKSLVSLFSLLALLALFAGVVAGSLNAAFSKPDKIETWIDQSQVYDNFVATSISQAFKQTGGDQSPASQSTTLNSQDPIVQQAIKASFSKQLIQQSVNNFLDGNYAWLQGKTDTPQFRIDLTAPKISLAKQVSHAVASHLSQIPACTPAQLSHLQSIDLLHIACRPAGIDPEGQASQLEQQIVSNSGFLSNSVITAQNLTPAKSEVVQPKPYYQKLSVLPSAYQLAQKLPYALALLGVISIVILFLLIPAKRQAWRLLAKLLIIAGVMLTVSKLAFDIIFNKAQDKVFNTNTNGQLQHALTDFVHRAIQYVSHIDVIAGAIYLLAAALIIVCLLVTRYRKPKLAAALETPVEATADRSVGPPAAKKKRPVMDVMAPPKLPKTRLGDAAPTGQAPAVEPIEASQPTAPVVPAGKPAGLARKGSIQ